MSNSAIRIGNRPKEEDVVLWRAAKLPFVWELQRIIDGTDAIDSLPTGYLYSFNWSTPVYDLRPDLRAADGSQRTGSPIWSNSARLFIQIMAANVSTTLPGLSVYSTDWINISEAQQQSRLGGGGGLPPNVVSTNISDVSARFATSTLDLVNSTVVGFSPPGSVLGGGEGYPVRYWRLSFVFSVFVAQDLPLPLVAPTPTPLVLQAAMH